MNFFFLPLECVSVELHVLFLYKLIIEKERKRVRDGKESEKRNHVLLHGPLMSGNFLPFS